jgi:hypothetical protein
VVRTVDQDRAAEIFGVAIAEAVRRAVHEVGLEPAPAEAEAPRVVDDVIDLTDAASTRNGPIDPLDPYEVLGVSPRATWEEIVAARNHLLRSWHPDAGGDEERLMTLNAAFAELRIRRAR